MQKRFFPEMKKKARDKDGLVHRSREMPGSGSRAERKGRQRSQKWSEREREREREKEEKMSIEMERLVPEN